MGTKFMKKLFAAALLLLPFLQSSLAIGKPPNIVFILTDNQSAELVGAYGNRDVLTPNIDRLAADGMRFEHAMAVNGMCSPTRATLPT